MVSPLVLGDDNGHFIISVYHKQSKTHFFCGATLTLTTSNTTEQ